MTYVTKFYLDVHDNLIYFWRFLAPNGVGFCYLFVANVTNQKDTYQLAKYRQDIAREKCPSSKDSLYFIDRLILVLLNKDLSLFKNTADPDPLTSNEAIWSFSALFSILLLNTRLYLESCELIRLK